MLASLALRRRSLQAAGLALLVLPGCAFSIGGERWDGDHAGGRNWTHIGWTTDDDHDGDHGDHGGDGADIDRRIADLERRLDELEWRLHHMPMHGHGGPPPMPGQPAPPPQGPQPR